MTIDNSHPMNSASYPAQTVSPAEERTWSVLAHLTVLLNLITGFAGPIAALVIYLIYRDRSRQIAFHALQSMIFQAIWWYGGGLLIGAMWAVVGLLSIFLVGIILIPFALILTALFALLPLGALIYGVIAAIQVNHDPNFKYWLVGDWLRSH